jgi:predicted transcriptional regulator
VLSIKENEKIKRAPRGAYRDLIIDIVYSSGCVTLTKLVEIIAEKLGKPRKTVYNSVAHILVKLVKHGVVERRAEGVYCKPGFDK